MYQVIDLRENPPIAVINTLFETEQECIDWIANNGDATIYTIEKID